MFSGFPLRAGPSKSENMVSVKQQDCWRHYGALRRNKQGHPLGARATRDIPGGFSPGAQAESYRSQDRALAGAVFAPDEIDFCNYAPASLAGGRGPNAMPNVHMRICVCANL